MAKESTALIETDNRDCQAFDTSPKGIPLEKIIELYTKGLSQSEIAKYFNCSRQAINARVSPYLEDLQALPDFKKFRADVLAFHQRRLLNSLDNESIQKASPFQRVGMFGILYDKERLERGESTENVSYIDMTRTRAQMEADRIRLEAELGLDESESFIDVNTPIAEDE